MFPLIFSDKARAVGRGRRSLKLFSFIWYVMTPNAYLVSKVAELLDKVVFIVTQSFGDFTGMGVKKELDLKALHFLCIPFWENEHSIELDPTHLLQTPHGCLLCSVERFLFMLNASTFVFPMLTWSLSFNLCFLVVYLFSNWGKMLAAIPRSSAHNDSQGSPALGTGLLVQLWTTGGWAQITGGHPL